MECLLQRQSAGLVNLCLYSVNSVQFLVSVRHQFKILLWCQWINEEYLKGSCILELKCSCGEKRAFHTSTLISIDGGKKKSSQTLCGFLRYGLKQLIFISCPGDLGSREVDCK